MRVLFIKIFDSKFNERLKRNLTIIKKNQNKGINNEKLRRKKNHNYHREEEQSHVPLVKAYEPAYKNDTQKKKKNKQTNYKSLSWS